jgi:3D (Asp-Asp-Asp) domain-containing protein
MKNLVRVAALSAAFAAALCAPTAATSARSGDVQGPACADITNGGVVSYDASSRTLVFGINTANPSCTDVTYTLYVTLDNGTVLAPVSVQGNRFVDTTVFPNQPRLDVTVNGVFGSTVCVSATSSARQGNTIDLFDRAPDANCVEFDLTGGGSAFGNFT